MAQLHATLAVVGVVAAGAIDVVIGIGGAVRAGTGQHIVSVWRVPEAGDDRTCLGQRQRLA